MALPNHIPRNCPMCGRDIESRTGPCLIVPQGAEHTPPRGLGQLQVVNAQIYFCVAAWVDCSWFEAGHVVDGAFLLDPDLMPLTSDELQAFLAHCEDQEKKRRPRHEPGE